MQAANAQCMVQFAVSFARRLGDVQRSCFEGHPGPGRTCRCAGANSFLGHGSRGLPLGGIAADVGLHIAFAEPGGRTDFHDFGESGQVFDVPIDRGTADAA